MAPLNERHFYHKELCLITYGHRLYHHLSLGILVRLLIIYLMEDLMVRSQSFFLCFILNLATTLLGTAQQPTAEMSYSAWEQACLAYNKTLSASPKNAPDSPINKTNFMATRDAFIAIYEQQLTKQKSWINPTKNPSAALLKYQFNPYVQKCVMQPGTTITVIGDLHGDYEALMSIFDTLRNNGLLYKNFKLKASHSIIFLGDYTDRGPYGVEVLYTIFKLKIANPERIFLLRGNHEDACINEFCGTFGQELNDKFSLTTLLDRQQFMYNVYELLPVALYVSTPNNDNVMFCHGGLEVGFDPEPLLQAPATTTFMCIDTINRTKALSLLTPKNGSLNIQPNKDCRDGIVPKAPGDLHFLWNDFQENPSTCYNFQRGTGLIYGNILTEALLKRDHIKALFRGHDHQLTLNGHGLHHLYEGLVSTLVSFRKLGPLTFFEHYSFITIHIGKFFADWEMWHEHDSYFSPITLPNSNLI